MIDWQKLKIVQSNMEKEKQKMKDTDIEIGSIWVRDGKKYKVEYVGDLVAQNFGVFHGIIVNIINVTNNIAPKIYNIVGKTISTVIISYPPLRHTLNLLD